MSAKLIILAGIPGCGKSTWAETLLDYQYEIISTDKIRSELGDVNDQTRNGEVFQLFHSRISQVLDMGGDVVADSTALDAQSRTDLRKIADACGAQKHLVYFSNCDQAIRRNFQRHRQVPDDVMVRMLDKYERFMRNLPFEQGMYNSITEIRSTR